MTTQTSETLKKLIPQQQIDNLNFPNAQKAQSSTIE
jgi:hypothetical protein